MPTEAEYQNAIALRDIYIAELEKVIADMQAVIDGMPKPPVEPKPEPEPPKPPLTRQMFVGSSVQAQGLTQAQAITNLETVLGKRLGARREFDADGVDAAWLKAAAALDKGRARIYSHKGMASQLTGACYDALPQDGFPTYWVLQHEAERVEKGNDPARMRAEFDAWIAKIKAYNNASGRTDIHPGVVYTGWLDRDPSPTTSTVTWMPSITDGVVFLIDPYDPLGQRTLRQQYMPALTVARKHGFTRWGIAETGTHRDDVARAAWIREGMKDAHTDGAEILCWFHSDVGGNAGATGWFLEGAATIKAFAEHLPAVVG